MKELTDEELLYASPEDWAFFNKCIEGLPAISDKSGVKISANGEVVPYGSGPHILKYFRETINLVKPKSILEIGFNVGYGASMLLKLSDAYVISLDKTSREETFIAVNHLTEKYQYEAPHKDMVVGFYNRFHFLNVDSKSAYDHLKGHYYDLCFIDGGHEEENVTKDIQLCKDLKIPYLLFDDIYSRFGPGVLPSIAKFPELELVKDMNNLRLYKVKYE